MEEMVVYEIQIADVDSREITEFFTSSDVESTNEYVEKYNGVDGENNSNLKLLCIEKCPQNNDNKFSENFAAFDDQGQGSTSYEHKNSPCSNNSDINIRLKRWAIQAEITVPKLNSLLRILKCYHPSLPYCAKDLLDEDDYSKLSNKDTQRKIISKRRSSNDLSELVQQELACLQEEVKIHFNSKIKKLKRFINAELDDKMEEGGLEQRLTSNHLKYQRIMNRFPITKIDEVDEIEEEIKQNKEFRRNFIEALEYMKGNDTEQKFIRNIFSDEVLADFTFNKNRNNKKLITDYNLFLVVIYEVLCDSNESLSSFLEMIKTELKRARDRISASVRLKRIRENKLD